MTHVVFVHGIANKPEPKELLRRYRAAVANGAEALDLGAEGIDTSLVYWADVMYTDATPASEFESAVGLDSIEGVDAIDLVPGGEESPEEQEWFKKIAERLELDDTTLVAGDLDEKEEPEPESKGENQPEYLERIPLPWFVKRRFLRLFLRDVHHYLFNTVSEPRPGEVYETQTVIRRRFVDALNAAGDDGGPLVVVAHSMGTVIAYDCLKRVSGCPEIDALITIGTPLGIDEVQDKLQPEWNRDDGFPSKRVSGSWANIYDSLDVVSRLDPKLANDFRKNKQAVVTDSTQDNGGIWRHDAEKYLRGPVFQTALMDVLDLN